MMNIGKGYLTYILAAAAVAVGVAGLVTGNFDELTAAGIVWAGLGLFGLRRAL